MDDQELKNLICLSHKAKDHSYSRYSNFRVGCALVTQGGDIFTGCNVENASYGLAICAERTALVKAVSEGHRKFKAVVVASDMKNEFISPCGACRQFIIEFGGDIEVYMTKPDHTWIMLKADELLPIGVGPKLLEMERVERS
ncbi:cytidine deaminase-like [Glandiceps talaboti]